MRISAQRINVQQRIYPRSCALAALVFSASDSGSSMIPEGEWLLLEGQELCAYLLAQHFEANGHLHCEVTDWSEDQITGLITILCHFPVVPSSVRLVR